ncbi:glycosyltransferase [Brevundimonas sp.]|jgi:hypothetical protein|uniref:glycosyltransferase n=1 Tax=Brevundimonas sp. TaxID=1871086 RepID=UPI0037C14F28
MTGLIGYYVHHQGEGHYQRASKIAAVAPKRFVLLGTGLTGRAQGLCEVPLEDDRRTGDAGFAGDDGVEDRPQALHYAPYGVAGLRRRVAAMAAWIAEAEPALMVVDVSVEAAMLARLSSTPVVYVRLSGDRRDPAHLDAFRGAKALMAPWHKALEPTSAPSWIRDKTRYVAPEARAAPAAAPQTVLVVHGRGGRPLDGAALAASAAATPAYRWTCVGPVDDLDRAPPNLTHLGWVDDVAAEVDRHSIIVGGAGDGLVNTVLEAGRAFVCVPEARAYAEQADKAARLAHLQAAIVSTHWPEPSAWADLLFAAETLPTAGRRRLLGDGYAGAGRWLLDCAEGRWSN